MGPDGTQTASHENPAADRPKIEPSDRLSRSAPPATAGTQAIASSSDKVKIGRGITPAILRGPRGDRQSETRSIHAPALRVDLDLRIGVVGAAIIFHTPDDLVLVAAPHLAPGHWARGHRAPVRDVEVAVLEGRVTDELDGRRALRAGPADLVVSPLADVHLLRRHDPSGAIRMEDDDDVLGRHVALR